MSRRLSTTALAPRHEELHSNDRRSFELFGKWYHWELSETGTLSLVQGLTEADQLKASEARARIETALKTLEESHRVDSLTEVQEDVKTVTLAELMEQGVTEADLNDAPVIRTYGEPVPVEKPAHELTEVDYTAGNTHARWTCSCGKTGTTSSSHDGEDLEAKAKKNQAAHARREAKKADQ